MASEFEKLLEDVAREVEKEAFAYKKPIDIGGLLKRRLLPLLEAGQAMRDSASSDHGEICGAMAEWDSQQQAALEGR